MNTGQILVVDDNRNILNTIEILLSKEYKTIDTLNNPNQLLHAIGKKDYNCVILDMNFRAGIQTGNEGLYWLQRIKEVKPEISVIMITAYGDVELAVNAVKAGATDFILKPWDNQKFLATINTAVKLNLSKNEINSLKEKQQVLTNELRGNNKQIIGESPKLLEVLDIVEQVAKTDANILITGENGTGKELIAYAIHNNSNRRDEILINVDMGAITETLFESEFFGHTKGSFTDAKEDRAGKFESAHGGTLFLDEIGNLPYNLQAKLLTAIQSKQVVRVGSVKTIPIDVRMIFATNKNLEQMVKENTFREDLYFRINTIQIEIPPLRQRGEDVVLLANFFIDKYSKKYNKNIQQVNSKVKEKLMKYTWPGNVRELQHTIEKAVILCNDSELKVENLFLKSTSTQSFNMHDVTLDEMEKQFIETTLKNNNFNMSAVAEKLGISRQTLYNKMKKYNL